MARQVSYLMRADMRAISTHMSTASGLEETRGADREAGELRETSWS